MADDLLRIKEERARREVILTEKQRKKIKKAARLLAKNRDEGVNFAPCEQLRDIFYLSSEEEREDIFEEIIGTLSDRD